MSSLVLVSCMGVRSGSTVVRNFASVAESVGIGRRGSEDWAA